MNIRNKDPELFKRIVHRGKIFARMLPEQKIDLIECLKQLGRQVIMCGDGCNDCGALKTAHAGISLSTSDVFHWSSKREEQLWSRLLLPSSLVLPSVSHNLSVSSWSSTSGRSRAMTSTW